MIMPAAIATVVAMALGGLLLRAREGNSQVWRGVLIGLNAGLNWYFAWWLLQRVSAGWAIAAGLALIGFLSVFSPIGYSRVYHFVLGWLSWLMPMSWPIHAIGLGALVLNLIGDVIFGLLFRIQLFRVTGAGLNWREGVIYIVGGWIGNVNLEHTAYNLGAFVYVHWNWSAAGLSWDELIEHETGHALSLGAFGFVFHLAEWIDEIVRRGDAPAEHIADSNAMPRRPAYIPQWGA